MINYTLAHLISEEAEKDAELYEKEILPLIKCIAYDNGAHEKVDGGKWELLGWVSIAYIKAKQLAKDYDLLAIFDDIFENETINEAAKELQAMFRKEIEAEIEYNKAVLI